MAGKAQLILVIGLGFLLGGVSMNLNRWARSAGHNSTYYYEALTSHNLALAGAQVGITKAVKDSSWFGSQDYVENSSGGTYTVVRDAAEPLVVRCISTLNGFNDVLHDTIEVYLAEPTFTSFTLFSWMTNGEGPCQWVSGDSVMGRLHSNGSIAINGSPVFMDRVTTAHKFTPSPGKGTDQAIFNKGYETGVDSVYFPSDLQAVFNVANDPSGKFYNNSNIWITLDPGNSGVHGDGLALVRASKNGPVIDSVRIGLGGFSGVLMGDDTVHVQGTLDGQLTISSNMGDIYVEDNLFYEQDPRVVPTSKDLLGLVAERSVIIADNAANRADCVVEGNIFARSGSLTGENYSNGTLRGRLSIYGSIVQNIRGAVGTNLNGVLNSGYFKSYAYDGRLYDPNFRPPSYPGFIPATSPIIGWWESMRLPDLGQYSI
jgi:hypothetical protein